MDVHPLIKGRKSIRAFADTPVEDEALLLLVEAARWAPSSNNEQPWRFIVIKKEEKLTFQKALSCLKDNNRVWAEHAAALIIVIAKTSFTKNNQLNLHYYHDTGLATGNLSLQATALGIFMRQMAGFDAGKTGSLFSIPRGYEPVNIIALGYKGDLDALPESLKQKETAQRVRKPLEEILFSGNFGEKSILSDKNKK